MASINAVIRWKKNGQPCAKECINYDVELVKQMARQVRTWPGCTDVRIFRIEADTRPRCPDCGRVMEQDGGHPYCEYCEG